MLSKSYDFPYAAEQDFKKFLTCRKEKLNQPEYYDSDGNFGINLAFLISYSTLKHFLFTYLLQYKIERKLIFKYI